MNPSGRKLSGEGLKAVKTSRIAQDGNARSVTS